MYNKTVFDLNKNGKHTLTSLALICPPTGTFSHSTMTFCPGDNFPVKYNGWAQLTASFNCSSGFISNLNIHLAASSFDSFTHTHYIRIHIHIYLKLCRTGVLIYSRLFICFRQIEIELIGL